MRLNGIHRSAIALAVYLAAFVALVLIQFSRADKSEERAGAIDITVLDRLRDGSASERFPDELRLSFNGMTFVFGSGIPLAVRSVEGGHVALQPLSWRSSEEAVDVFFERRLSLTFKAPADGSTFSVTARSPEADIANVILPYGLSGAALEESKGEGISLRSKSAAYGLSLSGGTRLDAEGHSLMVQNGDGVFRLARRTEAPRPEASKAPAAALKLSPMDTQEYRNLVDGWLNAAWSGLSRDRLTLAAGGWKTGSGTEFSEAALMAYAAEARRRGAWDQHAETIYALAKANASRLSWKSSPYFGNLQRLAADLLSADEAFAARVAALSEARDPSLFLLDGLAPFLVDRAPAGTARSVYDFAQTLDAEKLPLDAACGLSICMAEAESAFPGSENPFRAASSFLDKVLPRSVASLPEGLFLGADGKTASLGLQLRLGFSLASWGGLKGSPRVLALGQRLVASALSLADASGILPSTVSIAGKTLGPRSGVLAPEDLYPLATENPWYPRQISLRSQVGPGAWVWTAAPAIAVDSSASRLMLSVKHETGSAHYLMAFGIRPFNQIKLYDIPYRAATDFEIYNASGYLYQRSASLLMVKLKHKKETELIELDY